MSVWLRSEGCHPYPRSGPWMQTLRQRPVCRRVIGVRVGPPCELWSWDGPSELSPVRYLPPTRPWLWSALGDLTWSVAGPLREKFLGGLDCEPSPG